MVLVADDNATNQFALKMMLKHFGVLADFANNGEEAVRMACESTSRPCCGPYRLVLLDISMPVMDGYEAAKAIMEHVGKETTAIVGVTGFEKKNIFEKAQGAGMQDVLTKPVDINTMEGLLKQHIL